MKRIAVLMAIFLLIGGQAFAANWKTVEVVASEDTSTFVDAPSTLTRYSKSFSVKDTLNPVGVMYKATSDGTVTVSLQVEQSYQRPTTELSSDATYVGWEAAESVSDENWHAMTLDTVTMPFARFKLVGSGSNDATTYIQFRVIKQ
jgi:hypothetical protein